MTNAEIKTGTKLTLERRAVNCYGTRNHKPVVKEVASVTAASFDENYVDYFTFKGSETRYRLGGGYIYAITGKQLEYNIL